MTAFTDKAAAMAATKAAEKEAQRLAGLVHIAEKIDAIEAAVADDSYDGDDAAAEMEQQLGALEASADDETQAKMDTGQKTKVTAAFAKASALVGRPVKMVVKK